MKNVLRVIAIVLMLLCLLVLAPSAIIVAQAENIVEIPLDAASGMPPREECYLSDWAYEDPSISVTIEKGRFERTNYLVARIKLQNASQLRSALSSGYYNPSSRSPVTVAKNVQAVFAINGDFYGENYGRGVMIRQGKLYRSFKANTYYRHDKPVGNWDILMIDDKGDMHILQAAEKADVEAFLDTHTVVNSFNFGPGLIVDGEPQSGYKNMNDGADIAAQRMVFCQTGELEYLCVYTEGPEDPPDKAGLNLEQMTALLMEIGGIQNAYNLDGGSSSAMVFRQGGAAYAKINGNTSKVRPIYDILYFASAYSPD